ncbi:MAG: hypothetical protein HQ445_14055 [Polaromonas sp.]|nr:hypothetical protein [Polaromonas sp.]
MVTKSKLAAVPSTAVAVKTTGSNVVNIQDMLRAQAAAVSGMTAPATGNFIRVTQDKQFMLPDGTKTQGPLQLVIVDFTSSNKFYENAFDKDNIAPPACFAIGTNPLKMLPSPNAPLAQATDCQSCPMNQFGSAGKGKACKNTRILAVLPPDADADTPLWLLATSPTANKGFDGFVNSVARVFQMPPVGVITTVGFDSNESYAKLTFSDPQPNANVGDHFARQDEAREILTAEPDVSSFVKEKPAARGKVAARR